jgi:hypothetical protein
MSGDLPQLWTEFHNTVPCLWGPEAVPVRAHMRTAEQSSHIESHSASSLCASSKINVSFLKLDILKIIFWQLHHIPQGGASSSWSGGQWPTPTSKPLRCLCFHQHGYKGGLPCRPWLERVDSDSHNRFRFKGDERERKKGRFLLTNQIAKPELKTKTILGPNLEIGKSNASK